MNHLYLKALTEWTPNAGEARDFSSSERAAAFCCEHQIPAALVVLKFDSDKYDIHVPVIEEYYHPA